MEYKWEDSDSEEEKGGLNEDMGSNEVFENVAHEEVVNSMPERLDDFKHVSSLCICKDPDNSHRPSCLSGLIQATERIMQADIKFIEHHYMQKPGWWNTIKLLEKEQREDASRPLYLERLIEFSKNVTATMQHYKRELQISVFYHENITQCPFGEPDMVKAKIKYLLNHHHLMLKRHPTIVNDMEQYKANDKQ